MTRLVEHFYDIELSFKQWYAKQIIDKIHFRIKKHWVRA